MQNEKYLDVQNDFGRQDICVYLYPMNSIPFIHINEISLRARKHSFTLKDPFVLIHMHENVEIHTDLVSWLVPNVCSFFSPTEKKVA